MQEELLGNHGLVYGSGRKILGWHPGLAEPVTLAIRDENSARQGHVTAVAYSGGRLADAGYDGTVRDTLTGDQRGTAQGNPIFGLAEYQGELIAAAHQDERRLARFGLDWQKVDGARIYSVDSDETIAQLGRRTWWKPSKYSDIKELGYRSHSLDLTVADGVIYVSSENVLAVHQRPQTRTSRAVAKISQGARFFSEGSIAHMILSDLATEGRELEHTVQELLPYRCDFTILASNGRDAYALSEHNAGTHPKGGEIQMLPSGDVAGTWIPLPDWARPELIAASIFSSPQGIVVEMLSAYDPEMLGPVLGFKRMATVVGDTLILGTKNFDSGENNLYALPLTERMRTRPQGEKVRPQLLLRNAFESRMGPYGKGNPIVAVPRDELEGLLSEAS